MASSIIILDLIYKFMLALALGALIGIDREKNLQKHKGTDFAGVRTFMLIAIFGGVSSYISFLYYQWLMAVFVVCFIGIILAGYVLSSYFNKEIGMTTELSAIMTFFIGVLVFTTSQEIPILLTITITLILSFKTSLHNFVYNIKDNEYFDTIKFILIAFVILPILKPIEPFGPFDSINLYEIWLMVVFVSALSYIAYILIRIFGSNKGTLITGLLGGILSSTAVMSTFANKSKSENADISPMAMAATFASSTMFLRVIIEIGLMNNVLMQEIMPFLVLMAVAGYLSVLLFWRKKQVVDASLEFKSPLLLGPAFKFGLFYGLVYVISNMAYFYFGPKGILISSFISGFADVDAITLYIARSPNIDVGIGMAGILLAATINTVMKVFIAKLFGKKEFGQMVLKVSVPMIVLGFILVLIMI